jgi:hypothetical protein
MSSACTWDTVRSCSTYVSIRQYFSAYVSIRQPARVRGTLCEAAQQAFAYVIIFPHTSAYVSTDSRYVQRLCVVEGHYAKLHTLAFVRIRPHTSAYVSYVQRLCMVEGHYAKLQIDEHKSAYVSIRQHTAACSIRQHTSAYVRTMRSCDSTRIHQGIRARATYSCVSIRTFVLLRRKAYFCTRSKTSKSSTCESTSIAYFCTSSKAYICTSSKTSKSSSMHLRIDQHR